MACNLKHIINKSSKTKNILKNKLHWISKMSNIKGDCYSYKDPINFQSFHFQAFMKFFYFVLSSVQLTNQVA